MTACPVTSNPALPIPLRTLSDARNNVGLTVRQLAQLAGTSPVTVTNYERGNRTELPEPRIMNEFIRLLHVEEETYKRLLAASATDKQNRDRQDPVEEIYTYYIDKENGMGLCPCFEFIKLRINAIPTVEEYLAREERSENAGTSDLHTAEQMDDAIYPHFKIGKVHTHHERALKAQAKKRRKPKGISQGEMAIRVGLSLKSYQDIEAGRVIPRDHTIATLAVVSGMSAEQIQRLCAVHNHHHKIIGQLSCRDTIRKLRQRWRG